MKKEKLELLKKIRLGSLSATTLTDIYYEHRDDHIFLLNLVQNPSFPVNLGLDIIPKLFPIELVRIIANKRTNPFLRKKCELEFVERYRKISRGEKISLIKVAPQSLLSYFIEESDEKILSAILNNNQCTEVIVINIINRKSDREIPYRLLAGSVWLKNAGVAEAISYDPHAPIRVWMEIIEVISAKRLKEIILNKNIHNIILKMIKTRLKVGQSE